MIDLSGHEEPLLPSSISSSHTRSQVRSFVMTMSVAQHVVDLCSSSDSEDGDVPPRRSSLVRRSPSRNFPLPPFRTVEIDDDEDNDNDNDNDDNHRKPASQVQRSAALKRKRLRQDVIDLSSVPSSSGSSSRIRTRGPIPAAAAARYPPDPACPIVIEDIQPYKTPRERVLEVFPDVATNHLEKLRQDCQDSVEMIMSILSDGSYPKDKSDGGRSTATFSARMMAPSSVRIARNYVKPMYDYTSTSSFQPTSEYIHEAVEMLLFEFPFIRVDSMRKFLKENKQHFTPVRNQILESLKKSNQPRKRGTHSDPELQKYQALKPVWVTKRPTNDQMECLGVRHCMKRFTRRPMPTLTDPILKDEVQYAQQQLATWMETMDEKQERQEARKRSEQSGNGMECGCCFGKVPIEEMVACRNEGHLFCMDCIQSYADTQIFANGSLGVVKATGVQACELLCFDASGCQSGFYEEQLQRVLRVKTLERYTELQFRASIEAAGMSEEICSCPKCGFQADLPLNLIIFQCPMDDCRFESCRKCGKEPHVPLRCEEVVQKQREDEGRLKVEEALAEAKIRKCPKCATAFVKSDGCNKMTCRCGAKVCYICRQELNRHNPYDHFCQLPHCDHKTCGKCILFSNAEEDDQRAMREAGLTAAQAYRQELQEKGSSGPEFNIDVDRIMTTGAAAPRRTVIVRNRR